MHTTFCVLLSAMIVVVAPAFGAQRTFVSTSGSDANTVSSCSLAFPCRSFGSAITVTDPNGEIVAVDSGGYGSVTVDRSVTIESPSGVYAGISVFPGANGVTINAPGVVVTLKGLTINGQGGNAGIDFVQGSRLTVEGCEVANVGGSNTAGIFVRAPGGTAVVKNVMIRETTWVGIWVKQDTSGQTTKLVADNVDVHAAAPWGIYVGGLGHLGIAEANLTHVTVTGSPNIGVTADSQAGGTALVSVANSTISNNTHGAFAQHTGASLVVATSTLASNSSYAFLQQLTANFLSRGDNTVHDNNGGGVQTLGTIGSLAPL